MCMLVFHLVSFPHNVLICNQENNHKQKAELLHKEMEKSASY